MFIVNAHILSLVVSDASKVLVKPLDPNTRPLENKDFVLLCTFVGDLQKTGPFIQWYKNSELIIDRQFKYVGANTDRLTIYQVGHADTNTYACEISGQKSPNYQLTVYCK